MRKLTILALFLLLMALNLPQALAQRQVVTLTCTGDALLGSNDPVSRTEYAFQRYIEKYGYEYPFAKLQGLFANDDITLVNLECVFNDDAPAQTSRYSFRGPTAYAGILTQGSIEVANLANNHSADYGRAGFASTLQALEDAGVRYCGTTAFGNYTYIWEKDGIKIGFVGLIPLYYEKNEKEIKKYFQALKDEGCQVIVASLHCGKEYNTIHGNIHDKYGGMLRKYGANIIIGNHPHVPQGVNVVNGVTQLYSLGNASFGGNTGVDEAVHCLQSYVAQFELTFEDGVYTGHQLTIWPIHISGVSPENNYQPVLVSGDDAQAVMKRIQKDTRFQLSPYVEGQGAVQPFVPFTP